MTGLAGARITDLRVETPASGLAVELWLENVRRVGVVMAGTLRLEGVRDVASEEPRAAADTFPLEPGFTIYAAEQTDRTLVLRCVRQTGPGEGDRPTFRFDCAKISSAFAPSLTRTLRALAGFYPMGGDTIGDHFGPGPRSFAIGELNARAARARRQ